MGSRYDEAKRYNYLEVGQLHSSEETCEQNLKKKMAEWVERKIKEFKKSIKRHKPQNLVDITLRISVVGLGFSPK